MMPVDSVLADFMSGLDLNISMLLYGLALTNLDEAIMKAKMIEMGQKNALGAIQVDDTIEDRKSSSSTTISMGTSH